MSHTLVEDDRLSVLIEAGASREPLPDIAIERQKEIAAYFPSVYSHFTSTALEVVSAILSRHFRYLPKRVYRLMHSFPPLELNDGAQLPSNPALGILNRFLTSSLDKTTKKKAVLRLSRKADQGDLNIALLYFFFFELIPSTAATGSVDSRLIDKVADVFDCFSLHKVLRSASTKYTSGLLEPISEIYKERLLEMDYRRVDHNYSGETKKAWGAFGTDFVRGAGIFSTDIRFNRELQVGAGTATFHSSSEGGPGWAHGGVNASVADVILAWCGSLMGIGGVTRTLSITYKNPVPLLCVCILRAEKEPDSENIFGGAYDEDGACLFQFNGVFTQIGAAKERNKRRAKL